MKLLALEIAGVRVDLAAAAPTARLEGLYGPFAGARGPAPWVIELAPAGAPATVLGGPVVLERGRWRVEGLGEDTWLDPATGRGAARLDPGLVAVNALVRAAVCWDVLARGGALLHAAAFRVHGAAHLCPGRSGAGKSTLSRRSGAMIADELAVVVPEGGSWLVHGTPWWRSEAPPSPLAAIYALAWGEPWIGPPAAGLTGVRHLATNLVLPHQGRREQERAFAAAARIAAAAPLRTLCFRPDTDVDALVRGAARARRVA